MKRNINSIDKIVRLILVALFIVLYVTGTVTGTWGIVLLVLAGVFLLTVLINWCPIYWIMGLTTYHKKEDKTPEAGK